MRCAPLGGWSRVGRVVVAFALAATCALAPRAGAAQTKPAPAAAAEAEESPSSPRAAVRQFLELGREGEWAEAARFLDLPEGAKNGEDLARKLKAVLDRAGPVELASVSGAAAGNTADKLPPGVDELVKVKGASQPVRLVHRKAGSDPEWVFSRATVQLVPKWFSTLEDRWAYEHLPELLTREGPAQLMLWQLAALVALLAVGRLVGGLLGGVTRAGLRRLLPKETSKEDLDELDGLVRRPLALSYTFVAVDLARPLLVLAPGADEVVGRLLRAVLVVCLGWLTVRVVEAVSKALLRAAVGDDGAQRRSVVPLATTTAKIGAFLLVVAAVLAQLGYEATSIVAGVGIGGLGLALAAQKTVEHLFGSVSIGLDQPFKVGDLVKVEEVLGRVEHIGLRSTRIRTLDRTLVSYPNGKLADLRIESFEARDRLRLHVMLALTMSTTASQVREVCERVEGVLRAHPKLWPDDVLVRLRALGEWSLDVEVMAWFEMRDVNEFADLRAEMLLAMLQEIEAAGTRLAFPTRTVELGAKAAEGLRG